MAKTPNQNKNLAPTDPKQLSHAKFQEFCQYMKHDWIRSRRISRASFMAVTFALSRHGDFATGEGIRVSQAGLVDESGCSHNTVRKVTDFLKEVGVLEVVELQRRHGSPSENYRFRKNIHVARVLEEKNRGPKSKLSSQTTQVVSTDTQAVSTDTLVVSTDTLDVSGDNNKTYNTSNSASVVVTPSASPSALSAEADQEDDGYDWKEFQESLNELDEKNSKPTLDEQWKTLVAQVKR